MSADARVCVCVCEVLFPPLSLRAAARTPHTKESARARAQNMTLTLEHAAAASATTAFRRRPTIDDSRAPAVGGHGNVKTYETYDLRETRGYSAGCTCRTRYKWRRRRGVVIGVVFVRRQIIQNIASARGGRPASPLRTSLLSCLARVRRPGPYVDLGFFFFIVTIISSFV